MLLDPTIISGYFCSFWGLWSRIEGHARVLGFVYIFCRPSLFIYMSGEGLNQKLIEFS